MSIIADLINFFQSFPGIGPRQARRFVYHLAGSEPKSLEEISKLLVRFHKEVSRCSTCFRIFEGKSNECVVCSNPNRDDSKLLVIEKDADLENMERNQIFDGRYHVLGGLLSPLRPEIQEKLRLKELYKRVEANKKLGEIVLALSATTEGDMTKRYIEKILEPIIKSRKFKISNLGRGLSTGTELEYSDRDTLKHAFENRK